MSTKIEKNCLPINVAAESYLIRQGHNRLSKIISNPCLSSKLERILEKTNFPEEDMDPAKLLLTYSDLDARLIRILNDKMVLKHFEEILLEPKIYYLAVKEIQSCLDVNFYSEELVYSAENLRSLLLAIHELQIKGQERA